MGWSMPSWSQSGVRRGSTSPFSIVVAPCGHCARGLQMPPTTTALTRNGTRPSTARAIRRLTIDSVVAGLVRDLPLAGGSPRAPH
jgi:hypothetical protein